MNLDFLKDKLKKINNGKTKKLELEEQLKKAEDKRPKKNKEVFNLFEDVFITIYESPMDPPGFIRLSITVNPTGKVPIQTWEYECNGELGVINTLLYWLEKDY